MRTTQIPNLLSEPEPHASIPSGENDQHGAGGMKIQHVQGEAKSSAIERSRRGIVGAAADFVID